MQKIKFIQLLLFITITLSYPRNSTTITDNQIQGRLNIVNGYSTECVMHKFYTGAGWTQIEGEIGRNGIDGLYFKHKGGVIKEVLVAESKWNKSNLNWSGKNKLIHQMSQEWILKTLYRLQKYKPLVEYNTIKRLIEYDQYRARLFKLFPIGEDKIQIRIYKIKNKSMSIYNTFIENTLHPITIGEPRNGFEREMVESYNICRAEALHKYFPMLSKENIKVLLLDNYLQKKDVERLIR